MRAGRPEPAVSGRTVRWVWRAPTLTSPGALAGARAALAGVSARSHSAPRITVAPASLPTWPGRKFIVGLPMKNFLPGQVGSDAGATVIRGAEWDLALTPANAARARASATGEVIVGARHTNLTVLPETAGSGLPARIYTVEPTGDLTFLHVRLAQHLVVASAPGTYRGTADQPIQLEFDQD